MTDASAQMRPRRLKFTTGDLPAALDDRQKLERWRELFDGVRWSCDQIRSSDERFQASFEAAQVGDVSITRFQGSISRLVRTRRHIAADDRTNFTLSIGARGIHVVRPDGAEQGLRDAGSAILIDQTEPVDFTFQGQLEYVAVGINRAQLAELVTSPEDAAFRLFPPNSAAVRHLSSYLRMLLAADDVGLDAGLNEHIATTLTDLVALSVGAGREGSILAEMRGLRAARLRAILSVIKTDFADAAFSTGALARRLGITPAYIQQLLQETGTTLTERVLELRLQKARRMLGDRRSNALKVSDIALACGFNEVSYFNRCFRRRFGESPTQSRAG